LDSFIPSNGNASNAVSQCPALLPLSWACRRLRETGNLGKDFASMTGLPLDLCLPSSEWGVQVFREAILLRVLTGAKES
jgi:hypothetical protein